MRLFGLQIQRAQPVERAVQISPVTPWRGGWFPLIREREPGAWQRNREHRVDNVISHHAVYACVSLIASDIGKLRLKLMKEDDKNVWSEVDHRNLSPVLLKPNGFQNYIQFKEWWATSKLLYGNTYALKERDNAGVIRALYLLDPSRVTVLVATDGTVFYRLSQDNLSGVEEASITVPASEIIHDRMNCLFHPLVGISPIYACGTAADMGLNIQDNSTKFFGKGSNPSGILSGDSIISESSAKDLADRWNEGFSGGNSGRVAVLGSGLQFTALRMSAVDSQLIDQLKWSAETVCSAFHVPPFKVGVGDTPTYQNAETLNQIYYSDCLQSHIESFEAVMNDGLELDDKRANLCIELDLDALLRMDSATQMETLAKGVAGAILTPNEARMKLDLKPLTGGDTAYMQQQNFSLSALDARDRSNPAPSSMDRRTPPAPAPAPSAEPTDDIPAKAIDDFLATLDAELLVAK
jgi:HK97 family phage portal protein